MDGHTMRIFVTQFHPDDDNIFVSGGWDDTVQVCLFKSMCKNLFLIQFLLDLFRFPFFVCLSPGKSQRQRASEFAARGAQGA